MKQDEINPKVGLCVKLSYFDSVSLASEVSLTKLAYISLRLVYQVLSLYCCVQKRFF